MKAKEPTAAYYTPSMVHALQRSIANRISHETNPEKLSEISRILDVSSEKESFEARYQKAKEFAYKHFDWEDDASVEYVGINKHKDEFVLGKKKVKFE